MSLVECPDCGKRVSSEAAACPECGRPMKAAPDTGTQCPYCDAYGVSKVRGLQGGSEVATALALCLLLLIPGIVYYIYIESIPYCSGCGRRVKPSSSA